MYDLKNISVNLINIVHEMLSLAMFDFNSSVGKVNRLTAVIRQSS